MNKGIRKAILDKFLVKAAVNRTMFGDKFTSNQLRWAFKDLTRLGVIRCIRQGERGVKNKPSWYELK